MQLDHYRGLSETERMEFALSRAAAAIAGREVVVHEAAEEDETTSLPLREARELFERGYLNAQLSRFGGDVAKTAAFIGMERSALHRKLKSMSIVVQDERPTSSAKESALKTSARQAATDNG